MISPLPTSPPFAESNNRNYPSSGALGSMSAYPHTQEDQPTQSISAYPQQPTSRITPHVAQLHVRSRSPKLGRRSSEDLNHEFETTGNSLGVAPHSASSVSPVAGLGTFTNKKVSPIGGIPRSSEDQEKPWAITLPADEEERRRGADDPQSATSSKAREMRRIMLERSPAATPADTTQAPVRQTVADRFESHGLPHQAQRTDHQFPQSSLSGVAQQSRVQEQRSTTPPLPTMTQQPQTFDGSPTVPPRPARRPSRGSEREIPVPAIPGTQPVSPPSRKTTPMTIGRPTTPSFMLRRDASLRGKGAQRTSTVIDEAGRAMIVSGLQKRSTTPISIGGHGSGRESLDAGGANRSSSYGSRDITPQQHDSTLPGRAPAATSHMPVESRASVPLVPHVPDTLRNQPIVSPTRTAQHGEPFTGSAGPGAGFIPTVAPSAAAASARTADPMSTGTDTNPLIKDQSLLSREPAIPTTTNMAAPSASTRLRSGPTDTNPLIENPIHRDPVASTTSNMPGAFEPTDHDSSPRDLNTRDRMPIIPTTSNMLNAPAPVDRNAEFSNTNPLIKDSSLVNRDPIIPTTTNMPGTLSSTNRSIDRDTNPLIKDQTLGSRDPIIPTTSNISGLGSRSVAANAESKLSHTAANNKNLKPLEVYEMMGSRPDGYESDDEPYMSATAYPGQEWQPVFESWED